ncbi:MAG: non-canonical purine NTP pyrophosphatase, partial [Dehalococcoidia bacterium]
ASFEAEPEIDEDAASHLGNAVRKAVAWSRLHQELAIASDGGLAIPALGQNWTSLVTRRATGGDASDEEHARRLLRRMRDLHGAGRSAHWVEAIAVARNGSLLGAWEASGLHGTIAEDYVAPDGGTGGFWVSGLWQRSDGRRYWALTPDELAAIGDPWDQLRVNVRGLLERIASVR